MSLIGTADPVLAGIGAPFLYAIAGEKILCLSMKQPGAIGLAKQLVMRADVIVENCAPQRAVGRGMTCPELKAIEHDIILASIIGFGQDHPDPVAPPAGIFETNNGHVAIQVGSSGPESGWGRLCNLMGRPALIDNPHWATGEGRLERQKELWAIVETWLKREFKDSEEAATTIPQHRLMAGPVLLPAETMRHPLEHPVAGNLATMATPIKFRPPRLP